MRRLAVLRPEPAASATVERAAAIGLEAFAMPLFKVEPLQWEIPDTIGFDALLLTSANAVVHGGAGLDRMAGLPVYAVGEATAAAAAEAGFEVAAVGDGGVDQMLDSLPSTFRLLHLCGEHRTEPSVARSITAVPVYRSTELPAPDGLERIEGETVAVHSSRSGRRLAELVDEGGMDRRSIRIAAISSHAAAAAGSGWQQCEAAETPSDSALLALASRLCDNRPTR